MTMELNGRQSQAPQAAGSNAKSDAEYSESGGVRPGRDAQADALCNLESRREARSQSARSGTDEHQSVDINQISLNIGCGDLQSASLPFTVKIHFQIQVRPLLLYLL